MCKYLAIALAALIGLASPALADIFIGPKDFVAPGTLLLITGGNQTVIVTATGTPSGATFAIQGSSDPAPKTTATWTTLQAVAVGTGTVVTSMTGTGKWAVNSSGMTAIRVNLTALSGGDLSLVMDGGAGLSVVQSTNGSGGGGGSTSPFQPSGNSKTISVTGTSSSTALTATGSQIVYNSGANTAYIGFGTGTTVVTTAAMPIPAGACIGLTSGSGDNIGAITASSTTTLVVTSGSGLAALSCASGGSGSGGNVNLNQVGGASYALGQTTMSASMPVAFASNQSALAITAASLPLPAGAATATGVAAVVTALGTPMQQTGGALAANQSVNQTQVNGVGVSTGNGVAGTGVQRVTIASDNSPLAITGGVASGSTPGPYSPLSGVASGVNKPLIGCDKSAPYDASTSGDTQLVAGVNNQAIFVCGYTIFAAGTVNVGLDYGTATNCATGTTHITPAFELTTQTGAVDGSPFWRGLTAPSASTGNELCLRTSGAVAVQAIVYYTQQAVP